MSDLVKKMGNSAVIRILTGQFFLVICCAVYLIWWFRGYRPGTIISRTGGFNGFLLLCMMLSGITGIFLSLSKPEITRELKADPYVILFSGIAGYLLLLFITRNLFHRAVTTELLLIVGWSALELTVLTRLNGAKVLTDSGFLAMCLVIAAAFIISIALYVAYYRMEETKAFYAAMVPLVTEAVTMMILLGMVGLAGR